MPPRGMATSEAVNKRSIEPSPPELLSAEVIRAMWDSPGPVRVCHWCMNMYEEKRKWSLDEVEILNRAIEQRSPNLLVDPAICLDCYRNVTEAPVQLDPYSQRLEPGLSNHRMPNIALRRS